MEGSIKKPQPEKNRETSVVGVDATPEATRDQTRLGSDTQTTTDGSSSVADAQGTAEETTKNEWQKSIEAQIDELKDANKELNRDRVSVITILGIFVAIFTFISIEIQILRFLCDFYKILGFTLIIPGVLLIFISLLDYVARSWITDAEKANFKSIGIVILIAILLMVSGSYFTFKSDADWRCDNGDLKQTIQIDTEPMESNVNIVFPESINVKLTE